MNMSADEKAILVALARLGNAGGNAGALRHCLSFGQHFEGAAQEFRAALTYLIKCGLVEKIHREPDPSTYKLTPDGWAAFRSIPPAECGQTLAEDEARTARFHRTGRI